MNSGPTSERVYDALKQRILAREFRPGAHLDPNSLASTLGSSVTPVRDSLHVLKGEMLVEARTSEGFYLPHIDAPSLQDLYLWNNAVLGLALKDRRTPSSNGQGRAAAMSGPLSTADHAACLFATIGRRSLNLENHRAIASINDRLHAARLVEAHVLEGVAEELHAIEEAIMRSAVAAVRTAIGSYHRRRMRAVSDIVRGLYRNGGR